MRRAPAPMKIAGEGDDQLEMVATRSAAGMTLVLTANQRVAKGREADLRLQDMLPKGDRAHGVRRLKGAAQEGEVTLASAKTAVVGFAVIVGAIRVGAIAPIVGSRVTSLLQLRSET